MAAVGAPSDVPESASVPLPAVSPAASTTSPRLQTMSVHQRRTKNTHTKTLGDQWGPLYVYGMGILISIPFACGAFLLILNWLIPDNKAPDWLSGYVAMAWVEIVLIVVNSIFYMFTVDIGTESPRPPDIDRMGICCGLGCASPIALIKASFWFMCLAVWKSQTAHLPVPEIRPKPDVLTFHDIWTDIIRGISGYIHFLIQVCAHVATWCDLIIGFTIILLLVGHLISSTEWYQSFKQRCTTSSSAARSSYGPVSTAAVELADLV
ncbi:hypothetical protein CALCODRAFT_503550 [Calocera cornea HHB12733]|uniref:Uncharacterized protein n=1 Tax=Calocera cornea HHB12733 TaxID=1353952 RepID=A0A165CUP1_9BASI|nr:hypothetical protein CALCODRAFT_503550 [Calocera cornea HHB12733]